MKITILLDNDSMVSGIKSEHGLSLFIEDGDLKILFDTGRTGLFLENALRLGVDLSKIDYLVLSHGHNDHSGGLSYLMDFYRQNNISKLPSFICHPEAFCKKEIRINLGITSFCLRKIGFPLTSEKIEESFKTVFTKKPFWLNENWVFLGEIPRDKYPDDEVCFGKIENIKRTFCKDKMLDDSALVCKTRDGLIVLVGCAHSGICNIIDYAKLVCANDKIIDIIGGFHLKGSSKKRLDRVQKYLQKISPAALHACHCTGKNKNILPKQENIGVGAALMYELLFFQ